ACVPHTGSGGHFHNDLLAFEAQYDGLDFIVDGGSFEYTGAPAMRDAFRSTAAHSTVVVQGREQRIWPAGPGYLFGVHQDAATDVLYVAPDALSLRTEYADVRHVRTFTWHGAALVIEDEVTAPAPAGWCISLHPAVAIAAMTATADAHVIRLERDGRALVIRLRGVGAPVVAEGWYSSGYGTRVPSSRLLAPVHGATATATLEFTGARSHARPPRRVSHASESMR
ncbi:MAG TPA: heparinase II/III-family protein, partial [Longimicrobiales bacterium]|nr:heparinase II/III-family protein [Longimicrobiales bacterium]